MNSNGGSTMTETPSIPMSQRKGTSPYNFPPSSVHETKDFKFRNYNGVSMQPEAIDLIHQWMKDIIWMLDVVLTQGPRPKLFALYFKNDKNKVAILTMLQRVREFAWTFLHRGQKRAKSAFECTFVSVEECKGRSGLSTVYLKSVGLAFSLRIQSRFFYIIEISLSSALFRPDGWLRSTEYCVSRLDHENLLEPEVGGGAEVLLHEMIHAVSEIHWEEYLKRVACDDARSYLSSKDGDAIEDIDFDTLPAEPRLDQLKKAFAWSEVYGNARVIALASLDSGGTYALNSADYHTQFVLAATHQYLEERLRLRKDRRLREPQLELIRFVSPKCSCLSCVPGVDARGEPQSFSVSAKQYQSLSPGSKKAFEQKRAQIQAMMQQPPTPTAHKFTLPDHYFKPMEPYDMPCQAPDLQSSPTTLADVVMTDSEDAESFLISDGRELDAYHKLVLGNDYEQSDEEDDVMLVVMSKADLREMRRDARELAKTNGARGK